MHDAIVVGAGPGGLTAAVYLGRFRRRCLVLRVNAHQETSVPRLYAAGDVVRGLNQVVVAASESAIAATDIHNKLRGN